ncbi:papain-like cysteine protease family protein [Mucilaginibacter sp. UYCu711]|uniref:papain-like cysteine protease family protein n=1 Tax=Mucilaginibacter sp. UYCu711 TaxID=3156339 RepID=UPI003D1F55EC
MKKILTICSLALVMLGICFTPAKAQVLNLPPPVDLGIQNISQQDPMWCWAAAAQQVIYWKKGGAPNQCELVAVAKGFNAQYCCTGGQCSTPGTFDNIRGLIYNYVGTYSALAAPANPDIIYSTLRNGKAIILYLQTSPTIGHFIVLRGMEWINTPYGVQAIFYVNDPMAIFTKPIPFSNLLSIWRAAIVVN